MDFIFYTRRDGSVGSMPAHPELKTEADWKRHCGDNSATNFRLMRSPSFKCAIFSPEADTYVDDVEQINKLKAEARTDACLAYQQSRQGGRCDSNFMALLTVLGGHENIGPKALACIDWLEQLWRDENSRNDDNFDFSNNGSIPHTYSEVREEANAE